VFFAVSQGLTERMRILRTCFARRLTH
jgi:hypothetical protein